MMTKPETKFSWHCPFRLYKVNWSETEKLEEKQLLKKYLIKNMQNLIFHEKSEN